MSLTANTWHLWHLWHIQHPVVNQLCGYSNSMWQVIWLVGFILTIFYYWLKSSKLYNLKKYDFISSFIKFILIIIHSDVWRLCGLFWTKKTNYPIYPRSEQIVRKYLWRYFDFILVFCKIANFSGFQYYFQFSRSNAEIEICLRFCNLYITKSDLT